MLEVDTETDNCGTFFWLIIFCSSVHGIKQQLNKHDAVPNNRNCSQMLA